MTPDRIERETTIAAPVERVWALITEAEHLGAWFGDAGAEIDLRPGGAMLLTWHRHGTFQARVETVDPPHTFAFRWLRREDNEPGEGTSTLVEMTLTREGSGTRLRVIESGFQQLSWTEEEQARYADENSEGWVVELDELRAYAGGLERA